MQLNYLEVNGNLEEVTCHGTPAFPMEYIWMIWICIQTGSYPGIGIRNWSWFMC